MERSFLKENMFSRGQYMDKEAENMDVWKEKVQQDIAEL
jgi:hypothetical protein